MAPDIVRLGQALADVATIGLLQARAIRQRDILTEQLQTALNSRALIEQRRRRRVTPTMPRSRMIRSTRVRLTGRPRRRSSAVTRGDPYAPRWSPWMPRISAASWSSAASQRPLPARAGSEAARGEAGTAESEATRPEGADREDDARRMLQRMLDTTPAAFADGAKMTVAEKH